MHSAQWIDNKNDGCVIVRVSPRFTFVLRPSLVRLRVRSVGARQGPGYCVPIFVEPR